MEIRRSYDLLISTMGFPILVRLHLYIESGPWLWQGRTYPYAKCSSCQWYIRSCWYLAEYLGGVTHRVISTWLRLSLADKYSSLEKVPLLRCEGKAGTFYNTENQELSCCKLCHHWWQHRLSEWQHPVLPVMTKVMVSSEWDKWLVLKM